MCIRDRHLAVRIRKLAVYNAVHFGELIHKVLFIVKSSRGVNYDNVAVSCLCGIYRIKNNSRRVCSLGAVSYTHLDVYKRQHLLYVLGNLFDGLVHSAHKLFRILVAVRQDFLKIKYSVDKYLAALNARFAPCLLYTSRCV